VPTGQAARGCDCFVSRPFDPSAMLTSTSSVQAGQVSSGQVTIDYFG
jgi:hypothetical protein